MSGRRLLLWRHGRTEWNATGRMQGQSDVALDDTGVRQAHEAAPLLAAFAPDLLVSSDLQRARVTAEVLGAVLGQPVEIDARLRETNLGPWQGLHADQISSLYPEQYAAWRRGEPFASDGMETFTDVATRMVAAIDDALARVEGTVVVVSHGAALRRALGPLLGWSDEVLWRLGPLSNCHWTELRHTATGWRLHAHNAGVLAPDTPVAAMDVEPPAAEYLTPAPTSH